MVTGMRSKRGMLNLCVLIQFVPTVVNENEEERRNTCDPKYGITGVKWKWILGSNIPEIKKGSPIVKLKSNALLVC